MKYIVTIDQSTSTTKAIIINQRGQIVGRSDVRHRQIYPKSGWVEHDPNEIYDNTIKAISQVMELTGTEKNAVSALAITNQRETTLLWSNSSGKPLYNAIVWQCGRAADVIKQQPIAANHEYIREATGIFLSPYFPAAKAKWLCDNLDVPKDAMFGTIDSWLVYKLTGNHATDYSNASRSQLFNIHKRVWDERAIDIFGLNHLAFPLVLSSNDIFGYTTVEGLFEKPIPVTGVMGDSHGAMFGQKCFEKGTGKATFGTGTSIMVNIGDEPILSNHGIVTSIAWSISGQVEYAFEGNINSSGDTIRWLADELGILDNAKQSEEFARKVDSSEGVYLVPAFYGLGAPHWDFDCSALISGIRRNTNKYHIARAGLESIAYQIKDIFVAIEKDMKSSVKVLKVDGGATQNDLLMQFVADMLDIEIVKGEIEEYSALGAAYAAGLSLGFWKDKKSLQDIPYAKKLFKPEMSRGAAAQFYNGWKQAVKRCLIKYDI